MGSIAELLKSRLPLNRKEVYFTATVLPGIICTENFKHFGRFLTLLGAPESAIQTACTTANIQFFTEYGLAEAIKGDHRKEMRDRFPTPPDSHERPDLMILIEGSEPLLILIEAKLYDGTLEANLVREMDRQKEKVVNYLRNLGHWSLLRTIHAALLPEAMKSQFRAPNILGKSEESLPSYRREIITWEQIRDIYADIGSTGYFCEILRIAIEEYDHLKGDQLIFGQYSDGVRKSGFEIFNGYGQSDFPFHMMGRFGGIRGAKLSEDIAKGGWRTYQYEVKESSEPRINWFLISDFINLVNKFTRQ